MAMTAGYEYLHSHQQIYAFTTCRDPHNTVSSFRGHIGYSVDIREHGVVRWCSGLSLQHFLLRSTTYTPAIETHSKHRYRLFQTTLRWAGIQKAEPAGRHMQIRN